MVCGLPDCFLIPSQQRTAAAHPCITCLPTTLTLVLPGSHLYGGEGLGAHEQASHIIAVIIVTNNRSEDLAQRLLVSSTCWQCGAICWSCSPGYLTSWLLLVEFLISMRSTPCISHRSPFRRLNTGCLLHWRPTQYWLRALWSLSLSHYSRWG